MRRPGESLEEFQERLDRDHAKFLKKLRRERWSLIGLLTGLLLYSCILPFTDSLHEILLAFSFFLICAGQFIYVMGMD